MAQDTAPRRSGRPPLTDRAALLAAARTLGFARLTVGLVTTAVGVKYSTFYRHYASLDALVTDLVDDVIATELVLPDTDTDWRDHLRETCSGLARLLDRWPGLVTATVALPELPAQVVELYRRLTDTLLAAGFDAGRASLGALCALETVAVTQLTTPGAGHTLPDRQRRLDAVDPAVAHSVRAVTAGLADDAADTWTRRKIELLIRGLEAERGTGTAPT